jgi:hypothetical protein
MLAFVAEPDRDELEPPSAGTEGGSDHAFRFS